MPITGMDSVINITDPAYGADPSGGSDSTAAIQAALNAVPLNGGTVYIPQGNFVVTAALNPTVSGTIITGNGWGSRIFFDGTLVPNGAIAMGDTTPRRVFIRDLRISQTSSSNAGTAINASYFQNSVIERVLIDAGGASGSNPLIGISFNATTTFYNVVSDSRIACGGANSIGIRFDNGANSNVVRNCRIVPDGVSASGNGVYVNTEAIKLDRVDIENAAGTAINIGPAGHACTIISPYLESNGTNLAIAAGVLTPVVIGGENKTATTANLTDAGSINPIILGVRATALLSYNYGAANPIPTPPNAWLAADHGMISWAYDPALIANNSAPAAGAAIFVKLPIRYATTISKVWFTIAAAATGVVAGQNFWGLYSIGATTATLLASGSADAVVATTGPVSVSITPQAVTPGYVLACFMGNATGMPTLGRTTGFPTFGNANLSTSGLRYFVNGTGLTTALAASITLSGNTNTGVQDYWAAVT